MYTVHLMRIDKWFTSLGTPWRRRQVLAEAGSDQLEQLDWTARPWKNALVLVCQECDGAADFTAVDALKGARTVVRSVASKKQARVTGSGCLDVCPRRGVAIAAVVDGSPARCAVVSTQASIQHLTEVLS
jgi:hypothetical protein